MDITSEKTFGKLVYHLNEDANQRLQLANWQELLEDLPTWSTEEFSKNQSIMVNYLINYFMTIPKMIVSELYNHFQLYAIDTTVLQKQLLIENLSIILKRMENIPSFSFARVAQLSTAEQIDFCKKRYAYYLSVFDRRNQNKEQNEELFTALQIMLANETSVLNLSLLAIIFDDIDLLLIKNQQAVHESLARLNEAAVSQKDAMSEWLITYCQTMRIENISEDKVAFLLDNPVTYLPNAWYDYFTGYLFFKAKKYELTYKIWQKLPLATWPRIRKEMQQFKKYLHGTDKKEIKVFILKQETTYTKKFLSISEQRQREKNKHWRMVGLVAIILITLPVAYTLSDDVMADTEYQKGMFDESINEDSDFDIDELSTQVSQEEFEQLNDYQQFIQAFLIGDEQAFREQVIDQATNSDNYALFEDNLSLPAVYATTPIAQLTYTENEEVDGKKHYIAIEDATSNKSAKYILELDGTSVTDVYGKNWHELPAKEFDQLYLDVCANAKNSIDFLVHDFLRATPEERQENIVHNNAFTEPAKEQLSQHVDMKKTDSLKYWRYSWTGDSQKAAVFYDKQDQVQLIVTFDKNNRINHLYLNDWEKLDRVEKANILDQVKEEKNPI